MSQPITGTNNALVTDLQGQTQSSGLITVFEVYLQDSDIGGAGVDKLYFHDGANGTADITWYSLLDDSNFGSTTSSKYGLQTYSAFPVESEGWEIRGSGTGSLPRPTVRFANINQYWSANLAKFDDICKIKYSGIIICVNHSEFKTFPLSKVSNSNTVIYDVKSMFEKKYERL